MARNTGNGGRRGPISNRTQLYNPKTNRYIKCDEKGKFMSCKKTPYKSVRRKESAKVHEELDKKIK